MEKDVEERLRAKFALIDRTDPSAIQAAQQVIIFENVFSLRFHSLKSTTTSHIFIWPRGYINFFHAQLSWARNLSCS